MESQNKNIDPNNVKNGKNNNAAKKRNKKKLTYTQKADNLDKYYSGVNKNIN
jgi:hypothetical protein